MANNSYPPIKGEKSEMFLLEVAKGNVPGHSVKGVLSRSNDITNTGFKHLWGSSADLVLPTAAETWELVSDSANDTSAGTGARLVLVSYLDANYMEKTVVASLNGTTPVTLNADHFRPNGAVVVSSGSGLKNEGTLTISASGGGDPRQFILPGMSQASDSHLTVPAGKSLYAMRVAPRYPKNESGRIRVVLTLFGTSTEVVAGEFPFYQDSNEIKIDAPIMVPEKTEFRLDADSDNAGPITVVSGFEFVLVDD